MVTDREAKTHLIFLIADTFLTRDEHAEALIHLDDIYDQLANSDVADIEVSSERVRNFVQIAYHIIKLGSEPDGRDDSKRIH
jgi:hypothetical protein